MLTITGTACNVPVYTNTLGMNGYSNMAINSDLFVEGDVYTTGRLDLGTTIYATFRLTSNVTFEGSNVFADTTNDFALDFLSTNVAGMSNMPTVIPASNIYDATTGIITVPMNGLYNLELQGSFSNASGASGVENGVWYKFLDSEYPNTRVGANVAQGSLLSTKHMAYLQGGQRLLPEFYSSDSNTVLVADNQETYVAFALATTYKTGSNS